MTERKIWNAIRSMVSQADRLRLVEDIGTKTDEEGTVHEFQIEDRVFVIREMK